MPLLFPRLHRHHVRRVGGLSSEGGGGGGGGLDVVAAHGTFFRISGQVATGLPTYAYNTAAHCPSAPLRRILLLLVVHLFLQLYPSATQFS